MLRRTSMLLLATTATGALQQLGSAPTQSTRPAAAGAAPSDLDEIRQLYDSECSRAESRREQAEAAQARLVAIGALRDTLWPLAPKLKPHDIDVITLDGTLTADALEKLLSHQACAVHVKSFIDAETCGEIATRLGAGGEIFSNWNIHQAKDSSFTATEVDKVGVTSGEALESWSAFKEYHSPSSPTSLNSLLPGKLNPFTALRSHLDAVHPEGCRLDRLGRWPLPAGTFRRMTTSKGLVHADTATLLGREAGEFSANLYIRTPKGKGALSVYPAQQYAATSDKGSGGLTSPALLADLQSLSLKQSAGFDEKAQRGLQAALPIKRTMDLADGDLVLINTGRFHGVAPYGGDDAGEGDTDAPNDALRLSGQCWLSFRKGKALRMWV